MRVAAAPVGFWLPPDTARPRIHKPARTRSRRAVFPGPGPRLWEGPGSRDRVARGGGAGNPGVPGPVFRLCAPSPAPLRRPALAPGTGTPRSTGVPGAPRRAAGGVWGRVGAAGSGQRGGSALRRGKFGRGKLPPRPPCREEGARGGWARAASLPLRREARPPPPRAPVSRPPAPVGQGAPCRLGSLPSAATRPSLPRHPALLPRGAAWGSPQCCRLGALRAAGTRAPAGGRVRSPAAARRSRRESGRERGSRGGVCARV